jgi:hypothetical protein
MYTHMFQNDVTKWCDIISWRFYRITGEKVGVQHQLFNFEYLSIENIYPENCDKIIDKKDCDVKKFFLRNIDK